MQIPGPALVEFVTIVLLLTAAPGLIALWLYVRALAERIEYLESQQLLDAAEIARQDREINELWRGVAVLIAQVRRAGMTPEWEPETAPVTTPPVAGQRAETSRLVDLWQRIADGFSMDEITDLAFRLGLPESHSDTAGARARELVNAARRRRLLKELVELCRNERPYGGF